MSVVFYLFIFFLCVSISMHACNARHFGVNNKNSVSTQFHYFSSENKVKVLGLKPIGGGRNNGDGIIDKSNNHVSAITHEEAKATLSVHTSIKSLVSVSWQSVPTKNHAGKSPGIISREMRFSPQHVRLLKATIVEGWRKRVLLVGSDIGTNEAEEMSSINKADDQKDVTAVVMDYKPPHQTPPIHNRQT